MNEILKAIRECRAYYAGSQDWVKVGAIRDMSAITNRQEFDSAMTALALAGLVVLAPEDVQCSLTDADRYNGVFVGGEVKHLVLI